jgi:predicted  nucleic acid-binding Zn-ribbon protein
MKGNNDYKYLKQKNLNNNKFEYNSNSNNMALIKSLKEEIEQLENEKGKLEEEITMLRKSTKNMKKEDYTKKIQNLENTRDEAKKTATHYLHMCSQLAEEVIVLRDQLDKYSHINQGQK